MELSLEQRADVLQRAKQSLIAIEAQSEVPRSAHDIDAINRQTTHIKHLQKLYENTKAGNPPALLDPGHQAIYNRYAGEITSYLKSLGAWKFGMPKVILGGRFRRAP
jgi:hypothetical protein